MNLQAISCVVGRRRGSTQHFGELSRTCMEPRHHLTRTPFSVGHCDLIGHTVREAFRELPDAIFDLIDRAYHSGEPYVGTEVRTVWDRGAGTPEEGFTNFVYQPLRDADGGVYGLMAHIVDVTE